MKFKLIGLILVFTPSVFAAAQSPYHSLTGLFSKLSDAGIDQVVELPYNKSLVSQLGKQVKVHNIVEMQGGNLRRPEAQSLLEGFNASFEYYNQRDVLPELTYKVGKGSCAYMEAIKVSSILVCYRKAYVNQSMLAPVSKYGQKCTTAMSQLSHCYIFAHRVDEVIKALSSNE